MPSDVPPSTSAAGSENFGERHTATQGDRGWPPAAGIGESLGEKRRALALGAHCPCLESRPPRRRSTCVSRRSTGAETSEGFATHTRKREAVVRRGQRVARSQGRLPRFVARKPFFTQRLCGGVLGGSPEAS